MTPEERDQLIEAVQAALVPFKEEIKTELLDPMEARLQAQVSDLDKRVISMNDDILQPFIHIAGRQHQELVERVERLEQAFSGLRSDVQRIERGPVRQLLDAAADTRGRLTTIEQRLAERGVLTTQDVIGTGERWVTWSEYRELETRIRVLEETATSYDILPGGDE